MTPLFMKALTFALIAHDDQKRLYTGEPYMVHPVAVAGMLAGHVTDTILAAALMHDVLEDTAATEADMCKEFGYNVTNLVMEVTNIAKPEDGNRATRRAINTAHLAKASMAGKLIKLADIYDNASSIVKSNPGFAGEYLQEKADVIKVLWIDNDPLGLWSKVNTMLHTEAAKLGITLE